LDIELALASFLFVLLMATAILLFSDRERSVTDKDRRMMHRLGVDTVGEPVSHRPLVIEAEDTSALGVGSNFVKRALDELIGQSGVRLSPALLSGLFLGLFLFGLLVGISYFDLAEAVGLAITFAVIPLSYVRFLRQARLKQFGQQLPYVVDLLRSALEAGHPLLRALQLAGENSPEPIAGELRRVVEQIQVGIPLPQALETIHRRIPEEELGFLAVAVRIQAQVGSSLAEILRHVAAGVRSRQRLQKQLKMLTAQSRASATIVTLLPFVVLAAFDLIRPGYAALLFHDPTGVKLLKTAIVLDLMAFFAMRRIARVNY
jgi:tight adherence protein B